MALPYFDLDVRADPPILAMRLHGELDFASAAELQLPPPPSASQILCMLLDPSGVIFCDVAGLRQLRQVCLDAERRGWNVRVIKVPGRLRRLAQTAGVASEWLNQN